MFNETGEIGICTSCERANYFRGMGGDEPDSKKVKGSQDIQGMTSKQYLDTQVVPHLLPALNAVSTNRPSDPIQYLVSIHGCI